MRFLLRAGDALHRADLGAQGAAGALFRINGVGQHGRAHVGGALLVVDVRGVFVGEGFHGGQHRVGHGLAQAAQRRVLDGHGQALQAVEVGRHALALGDLVEEFVEALGTDAAGGALAAGLVHGEVEEELGHGHHAGGLVHDDHAAGAHHGLAGDEALVVDGHIEVLVGQGAAGRTAGLDGLEFLAVGAAAADVEDDFAKRRAHGHFDEAHVGDLAGQGEDLGALGGGGADGGEPVRALEDDGRDVGERLDVVDDGGLFPIAGLGREGRLGHGLAALAFHGLDQGRFLAAHERAGAVLQLDVEVEARTEQVGAEHAVGLGILDGLAQALDGQGIFGPDVDRALGGADGIAADGHGLDHGMGVAFEHGAVHERARIAFVGVADHVLLVGLVGQGDAPLDAGGETAAATAAQPGLLHDVHDLGRRHGQDLGQGFVAAEGNVIVDILGIDEAAVAGGDPELLFLDRRCHVVVSPFGFTGQPVRSSRG